MVSQRLAMGGPTTGISEIHEGGGPSPRARKSFITIGLRSAASSSTLIARANGTMNVTNTASVIVAACDERV